jgi:hypothetical protein
VLGQALTRQRERQQALDSARHRFETVLRDETAAARSALLAELTAEDRLEALRLASRALAEQLVVQLARGERQPNHEERYLLAKAAAYLHRAASKTSPFGLFCATALVPVAGGTPRQQRPVALARTELLLSIAEVRKIGACLAVDRRLDRIAPVRINPTLRRGEEALTFWRAATLRREEDDVALQRIPRTAAVDLVCDLVGHSQSEQADLDRTRLAELLAERLGQPADAVERFVQRLIEAGLLIAECGIPYNEARPLRWLASSCREASAAAEWLDTIEAIEADVDTWPLSTTPARRALESRIAERLESLPHRRALEPDELLRVDAITAPGLSIPTRWLASVRQALGVYTRCFAAIYPERLFRADDIRRFLARYPADCDVPLIDLYQGVFDPSSAVRRDDRFHDPAHGSVPDQQAAASYRRIKDEFLAAARRGEPLEIDHQRLDEWLGPGVEPRWSAGVAFQATDAAGAVEQGGTPHFVVSGLFHGAGLAFARFARLHAEGAAPQHPSQTPLARELRRAWSILERPGARLAELTYNHTARTANAGLRPSILPLEIELPGEFATPGIASIHLAELSVRFDGGQQRFVLRAPGLDDELLPVISSGVNPDGLITFLVNIGQQGLQPIGLFAGFDDPAVTHWPRLVHRETVLLRERWVLRAGEWPDPALPAAEFFLAIAALRLRQRLPRHVFVGTSVEP